MNDLAKLWNEALLDIETTISKANFGTWFKNTRIVRHDSGVIYLGVPNAFVKEWLSTKYHKFILKAVRNLYPEVRALEYQIVKNEEMAKFKVADTTPKPIFGGQLEMPEIYINREDNLNPRYVFDSFIVGSFNELAHAATQAVIRNPGSVYNPLFIYGNTGVGKTHLIQSAGNHIKKNLPQKKVFYVTSEQFAIDYVNALQSNKIHIFKERYRKYDLLIIDDVQFFSNKDKMQEELFHLFNSFHEQNKQIIFSSDKPPKYIPNLEDRLRSRFEGGMIVDVAKPDYESRLAILQTKAKQAAIPPGGEILDFLANSIQDSIRELEGTLNTVICQAQVKNRPLSIQEVKLLVKNNLKPKKVPSVKNVAEIISSFYNIAERALYDKTRRKEVVKPRQIMMYILREDFNTSYPTIGQKLGGRDHTTVIHAYEKVKNDLKGDSVLTQELEQIRTMLYNEQS